MNLHVVQSLKHPHRGLDQSPSSAVPATKLEPSIIILHLPFDYSTINFVDSEYGKPPTTPFDTSSNHVLLNHTSPYIEMDDEVSLAERRCRLKWSQDPRNTFWSSGENNIMKLSNDLLQSILHHRNIILCLIIEVFLY